MLDDKIIQTTIIILINVVCHVMKAQELCLIQLE